RLVEPVLDRLPLHRVGAVPLGGEQLVHGGAQLARPLGEDAAEPGGLALDGGIVQPGQPGLVLPDLGEDRLQLPRLARVARPEVGAEDLLDRAVPPSARRYRATPEM